MFNLQPGLGSLSIILEGSGSGTSFRNPKLSFGKIKVNNVGRVKEQCNQKDIVLLVCAF